MPLVISQRTSTGWRDLTAAPPPLTSNLLVGAATFHPPLSAKASWTDVLEPQVGPLTVRRSYQSTAEGIPSSWAASEASIDVGKRASVLSVRPPIGEFIAGQHDARLRAFLRSIPDDGFPKFLVAWHEADSKVRRGEYSRQQFLDAFTRFSGIVHDEGVPNTFATPCFTNWLWLDPSHAAGQPEQWWLNGVYDVVSIDGYDASPSAMFDQAWQWCRAHDVPWAVAEVGMIDQANTAVKAAWIGDVAAYCASKPAGGWPSAVFMCWFDASTNFDPAVADRAPTPTSSAASIAAANTAAQAHYRDPRTLTL